MDRKEYLAGPMVPGLSFIITDDIVRITSDSTIFVDLKRIKEKIKLSDTLNAYKRLKDIYGKSDYFKIKGSRKFLTIIRSLHPKYSENFDQRDTLFQQIKELAKLIEIDGIHYGCRDDEYLNNLNKLSGQISPLHYRNSDYSQYVDRHYRLIDLLNRFEEEPDNMPFELRLY